jgi:hypothetical protein
MTDFNFFNEMGGRVVALIFFLIVRENQSPLLGEKKPET